MQRSGQITTVVLMSMLLAAAGCKKTASARNDQQIESDIQTKLAADNTLQGQSIVPAVDHGIATLTGTVNTEDARTLAGSDVASVEGVRTVVNDLTLPTEQAAAPSCGCPAPAPVHVHRKHFRSHPVLTAQNEEPVPPAPPAVSPEPATAPAPPAPVTVVRPAPVVVVPPPVYYPRPYLYAYGPGIGIWGRPWVRPGYRFYGRPYFYGRR